MVEERLEEIPELYLRSALNYALQTVKLPRRRAKPPFDHGAEQAERDVVIEAIIAKLKLSKWRVMHEAIPHAKVHANPDPFSTQPRTLRQLRGHLTELRVACPLCNRQGIYRLEKQIEKHGPNLPILEWLLGLTVDCPVRVATPEKCGAGMIDMEKVLRRLR
jgi:hypothetical protein